MITKVKQVDIETILQGTPDRRPVAGGAQQAMQNNQHRRTRIFKTKRMKLNCHNLI